MTEADGPFRYNLTGFSHSCKELDEIFRDLDVGTLNVGHISPKFKSYHFDINSICTVSGDTLMHLSIKYGTKEEAETGVQTLIKLGANYEMRNKRFQTPFDLAIAQNYRRLARLLYDIMHDPTLIDRLEDLSSLDDVQVDKWNRELFKAVTAGDGDTVEILLRRGANIDFVEDGIALLHQAICNCTVNKIGVVEKLLDNGVNTGLESLEKQSQIPITPIFATILRLKNDNIMENILQLLLRADVVVNDERVLTERDVRTLQVNPKDKRFKPYNLALHMKYENIAKILKPLTEFPALPEKKVNINEFKGNFHPAHLLVMNRGKSEQDVIIGLSEMFDKGLQRNIATRGEGDTLLHIACRKERQSVAEFLVSRNCTIVSKNKVGEYPITLAQRARNQPLERMLVRGNRKQLADAREKRSRVGKKLGQLTNPLYLATMNDKAAGQKAPQLS